MIPSEAQKTGQMSYSLTDEAKSPVQGERSWAEPPSVVLWGSFTNSRVRTGQERDQISIAKRTPVFLISSSKMCNLFIFLLLNCICSVPYILIIVSVHRDIVKIRKSGCSKTFAQCKHTHKKVLYCFYRKLFFFFVRNMFQNGWHVRSWCFVTPTL